MPAAATTLTKTNNKGNRFCEFVKQIAKEREKNARVFVVLFVVVVLGVVFGGGLFVILLVVFVVLAVLGEVDLLATGATAGGDDVAGVDFVEFL